MSLSRASSLSAQHSQRDKLEPSDLEFVHAIPVGSFRPCDQLSFVIGVDRMSGVQCAIAVRAVGVIVFDQRRDPCPMFVDPT